MTEISFMSWQKCAFQIYFKDDLSRREFEISSMCQKCQDDFFTGGLDDD